MLTDEQLLLEDEDDGRKFNAELRNVLAKSGKEKRFIIAKKSDAAQALLTHKRKPLRLDSHKFFIPVYDLNSKMMLLKCSRQVGKSVSLCNMILIESMAYEAFRTLYVSPSSMQTRQFSNEKLTPTINDTPLIKKYYQDKNCIQQVYEKTFTNAAHIFLRYAFLSPDRARGIPADRLCIDELQDILKDSVKVIAECLSFSRFQYELYAGTPKSHDNTIEEYWGWSDQMEWAVPCDKHTPKHYNILGTANIGKKSLICDKCGGQIYPESGQWVVTNPGGEYTGFHVTQLMVPWKQGEDEWKKQIIFKYENWPEATFHNEVLGVSHDQASKPITQTEIMQCCHPVSKQHQIPSEHLILTPDQEVLKRANFAGVDWGEGRGEGKVEAGKKRHASWTVVTIGTFVNENLFWPYYMKRYTGKEIDPEFIKRDLVRLCNIFKVRIIGADWGHGWGMNSHLINYLGRDRVMEFQYVAKMKERIKFDKLSFTFRVNRSMAISNFLTAIKDQDILFPVWEEFKTFARDILGVYIDYNERLKTMYYDHPIDQPDDAMHSLIYARLAGLISMGKY